MAGLGRLLVSFGGLWLATPAAADEPRPTDTQALETAQHHIDALEYPEAVNVLESLLRRGGAQPATVAHAYALMATAAASSGEEAQAVWAYQRLLAVEPGWQPPAEMSPRLAHALERARTELPNGSGLSVGLQRPRQAARGRPLPVTIVADTDALGLVRGARVYHRTAGARSYSKVTVRGGAPVDVVIPATGTGTGAALEVWAAALDEYGNEIAWVGGPSAPARIPLSATASAAGAGASQAHGHVGAGGGTEGGGSVAGQWWFWTGIVVVIAGAAVAGVLLTRPEPDCPAQRACFDVRVEAGAPP